MSAVRRLWQKCVLDGVQMPTLLHDLYSCVPQSNTGI